MKRTSLLLLTAVALLLAAGCKKKEPAKKAQAPKAEEPAREAPKPAPEAERAPAPAAEKPAPAPAPAADVRETTEERPTHDPAEYTYIGAPGVPVGPHTPPVAPTEEHAAADLYKKWKKVSVEETHGAPKQFDSPEEAALDVTTVNNRGRLAFEVVTMGDFDVLKDKFLPSADDYESFLRTTGTEEPEGALAELEAKLSRQFAEAVKSYGSEITPVKRFDRIEGQVSRGPVRLIRWYFTYKDKSGAEQKGCYSFGLMDKGWVLLDMNCPQEEPTS